MTSDQQLERELIIKALELNPDKSSREVASDILGIHYNTLRARMKEYNIPFRKPGRKKGYRKPITFITNKH